MTDTTKRAVCPAVLHFQDRPLPCVLNAGHAGGHQHADGDSGSVSGLSRGNCSAMWSPDADTVYVCTRRAKHAGYHLDDKINILWRGSWGPHTTTPVLDGRHPADRAADDTREELTLLRFGSLEGMFLTLREDNSRLHTRLTALEARLNPVCGHRDPSSGRSCQRPPEHYGEVHRDVTHDGDGTAWTTGHSSAEHRAEQLDSHREDQTTALDRPCTAGLRINGSSIPCVLRSHDDDQQDAEGDRWDVVLEGSVRVSRPRYEQLLKDSEKLSALEADDWIDP